MVSSIGEKKALSYYKFQLPVLDFPNERISEANKAHIERSQPISPSVCNLTTQPCGLEYFRLQL